MAGLIRETTPMAAANSSGGSPLPAPPAALQDALKAAAAKHLALPDLVL